MQTSSERFSEWVASMRPVVPDAWQRLSDTIIRGAEEVQRALGPGQPRDVCEAALRHELGLRGVTVEPGRAVRLRYKGVELPEQRLSLIVNGLVAVEVRAGDDVGEAHAAHLESLMRAADLPLGLVINFDGMLIRNSVYRLYNRVATAMLALLPRPEASDTSAVPD